MSSTTVTEGSSRTPAKSIKVPLLDLKAQYAPLREEMRRVVDAIFESQYFIMGPAVAECEKLIADLLRLRPCRGRLLGNRRLDYRADGRRDRAGR